MQRRCVLAGILGFQGFTEIRTKYTTPVHHVANIAGVCHLKSRSDSYARQINNDNDNNNINMVVIIIVLKRI